MALPKYDMPLYTHHFVGLNKKIKFRAFNVREQKILLQAKESENVSDQIDAMKQIVTLCTNGEFDVETAPFFDIEDLFLQIRIRSVSDIAEIGYKVKETAEVITVTIDMKEIKVSVADGHDKTIKFTDKLGVVMKYPTLTQIHEFSNDDNRLITACVDYIFDGDEIYSDVDEKELLDWFDDLDTEALMKVKKFFDTMPRLRYSTEIKFKDKEGNEKTSKIELEGIDAFFQ